MLGLAWQVALAQTGMDPGFGEHGWQTLDLSELSVARVLEGRPFLELAIV